MQYIPCEVKDSGLKETFTGRNSFCWQNMTRLQQHLLNLNEHNWDLSKYLETLNLICENCTYENIAKQREAVFAPIDASHSVDESYRAARCSFLPSGFLHDCTGQLEEAKCAGRCFLPPSLHTFCCNSAGGLQNNCRMVGCASMLRKKKSPEKVWRKRLTHQKRILGLYVFENKESKSSGLCRKDFIWNC